MAKATLIVFYISLVEKANLVSCMIYQRREDFWGEGWSFPQSSIKKSYDKEDL